MKANEIIGKIESLVKERIVLEDELIILPNLSKNLMVLISGCYAENGRFEFSKETNMNPKSKEETYTLYLKYLGEKNA